MGLWELLTVYIWNWVVYSVAMGGLYGCWYQGAWGLFWNDDDGLLTATCLKLWGGNAVEFPVDYLGMSEPDWAPAGADGAAAA